MYVRRSLSHCHLVVKQQNCELMVIQKYTGQPATCLEWMANFRSSYLRKLALQKDDMEWQIVCLSWLGLSGQNRLELDCSFADFCI